VTFLAPYRFGLTLLSQNCWQLSMIIQADFVKYESVLLSSWHMQQEEFINIRRLIASKNPRLLKWLPGFLLRYIERVVHQKDVNYFLNKYQSTNQDFCTDVLTEIGVNYTIEGIENIPKDGKCVIVMNHPLGGMDAMILVDALKNHRTDLKFIVNDLLLNLGRLNELFVGVNKHGKNSSQSIQKVNDLFASENCVCIFPAGLVSRRKKGLIRDLTWKKTFVRQSKLNDQVIIPVFIDGHLSNWFYNLSNFRQFLGIKANIEMFYLVDELYKQKGLTVAITVGKPILANTLSDDKSDSTHAEWFRNHIYTLND